MERALPQIRERIWNRLPEVPDGASLANLVEVEAVDFELRPLVEEFTKELPDHPLVEELFAWGGRYLEQQVRKTIRLHAGRDPAEVDGILTDAMSSLWEKRREFDPGKGAFVPWARGVARNRARSHRLPRRREDSLDADPDRPLDLPGPGPTAEDLVAAGAIAEGPPAKGFAEILKLVQESEPHKAIAFLLNRYLDRKPAEIVMEFKELPLPEALALVKQAVRKRYPEISGIDVLLAPLSARLSGLTETFGEYGRKKQKLEGEVGRWVAEVQRSVSSTVLQLGKQFLHCLSELTAAAHEIVWFLWMRLLYAAPVELRDEAHRELLPLVELFHEIYLRPELLSRDQIEWATAPLRKRIRPGRTLQEFADENFYAAVTQMVWAGRLAD